MHSRLRCEAWVCTVSTPLHRTSTSQLSALLLNHPVKTFYDEVVGRYVESMEAPDLYHAGFPCQPFSYAGKHGGQGDERGRVIEWLMLYIRRWMPKMVLLENVLGLLHLFPDVFDWILKQLQAAGYWVEHRTLNAWQHGLPHNRDRVFILVALCKGPFDWPQPIQPLTLTSLLDPLTPEEAAADLDKVIPPGRSGQAVLQAYQRCLEGGRRPSQIELVFDVDSSKVHVMEGRSPRLTRTRSANGGHWLSQRGRKQSLAERERLLGFNLPPSVSAALSRGA